MSISTLSDRVGRELVAFLWRQWVQIGVFGEPVEHPDPWAIDPEPLLLMTLRTGGREPRLFEEVLDWLRLNGTSVSLQRLRNLAATPDLRTVADAAVAWAGAHSPLLHGWRRRARMGDAEPLELGASRGSASDPILFAHGVAWVRFEPSAASYRPDTDAPAAFAFRLRRFFGVGSRAEVVRVLLTGLGTEVTAQRIAEATGFAKRNVHETLTALAEAGPILVDRRQNELVYTLHPAGWADVLDLTEPIPSFFDWIALLRVLVPVVLWLDRAEKSDRTDYLTASSARDLIEVIQPYLRTLGLRLPETSGRLGAAYLSVVEEVVEQILSMLGTGPRTADS